MPSRKVRRRAVFSPPDASIVESTFKVFAVATVDGAAIIEPMRELVPNLLWVREHPVRLAGCRFLTRMTVLRSPGFPRGGRLCFVLPREFVEDTKVANLDNFECRGDVRRLRDSFAKLLLDAVGASRNSPIRE